METENKQPRKILLLGSSGQLGQAFTELLGPLALVPKRKDFDLTRIDSCLRYLEENSFDAIINTAAYTDVDLAETERKLAWSINAQAPTELAQWATQNQIPFAHFSTDYVFSGEGTQPWKETDLTSPLNYYGVSKRAGEEGVLASKGNALIFRTSWVYAQRGKNFINTVLRLGREKKSLQMVCDQFGAPTLAEDLALGAWRAFLKAFQMDPFPTGIYHLNNLGETNRFELAQTVLEIALRLELLSQIPELLPVGSDKLPSLAKRPKNSRLSCQKANDAFGVQLPHWKASLEGYLKRLV